MLNTKNLGTEFKTICCEMTGIMLILNIQRGYFNTAPLDFCSLKPTVDLSICIVYLTEICGQPQTSINEYGTAEEKDYSDDFSFGPIDIE